MHLIEGDKQPMAARTFPQRRRQLPSTRCPATWYSENEGRGKKRAGVGEGGAEGGRVGRRAAGAAAAK